MKLICEVEYAGMVIPVSETSTGWHAKIGVADVELDYNPIESENTRLLFLADVDEIFPPVTRKFMLSDKGAEHLGKFVTLCRLSGGEGLPLNDELELPAILRQFADIRLLAFWYKPDAAAPYLADCTTFFRACMPSLFFNAEHN